MAHFIITSWGFDRFRWIYAVLLITPFLFFPGHALNISQANTSLPLALDVFWKLVISIGPVFLVLSVVSITTQKWLSVSYLKDKNYPYFLYAISNAGSLLGLFSYPFIFEYFFDLSQQQLLWKILYIVFIAVNIVAMLSVGVISELKHQKSSGARHTSINRWEMMQWLFLGMAGVVIFLSVNNLLTSRIAPIPLLWILPLGIYLVSFILNFKRHPWCPAFITDRITLILAFGGILFLLIKRCFFPSTISIIFLIFIEFLICMYCHNSLIKRRPKDDRDLSLFYVLISLGGFIGGMTVTWIVPLVSNVHVEFCFGLLLVAFTTVKGTLQAKDFLNWKAASLSLVFTIFLSLWVIVIGKYHFWWLYVLFFMVRLFVRRLAEIKNGTMVAAVYLSLLSPLVGWGLDPLGYVLFEGRNFYGIYEVLQRKGIRSLYNGQILHGMQSFYIGESKLPMSYYTLDGPFGQLMTSKQFDIHSIGVVGLGIGSVAALTRKDQTLDFYEIDPKVYQIATEYFSYLAKADARIQYYFGDARISMQKMPDKRYDAIVVDAFSGDAIPVHLINEEAVKLYKDRLNAKGMIIFHITNTFLRLEPVLQNIADRMGAHVVFKYYSKRDRISKDNSWAIFVWDNELYDKFVQEKWQLISEDNLAWGYFPVWTDQYSSVVPVFKYEGLIDDIKEFRPFYW